MGDSFTAWTVSVKEGVLLGLLPRERFAIVCHFLARALPHLLRMLLSSGILAGLQCEQCGMIKGEKGCKGPG